jgi:predicted HNH restriction endonuclease
MVQMAEKKRSLIDRSPEMLVAAYYLSRCGSPDLPRSTLPPAALGNQAWNAAYDTFFEVMGDGRSRAQFRNSLKNARDTFDIIFDNGRVGWKDKDGQQASLSRSFQILHEQWAQRLDRELEAFIFRLLSGSPNVNQSNFVGTQARTEGGTKVFMSTRRERDPRLRDDAIAIHGLSCMACGFDFAKAFGTLGLGFIEVHHVTPLSEVGLSETDPKTDLTVLCSNCHRMVHRKKGICLSIEELKVHLSQN